MKRILVVEDNDNNLYLIRFILEKSGYDVIEAKEGAAAVEMALAERPHLIIMDIQLPDINGLEVTKRIRAAETGREVPIVALTSYAMIGDKERALDAGCTGYIEKPIDPERFVTEIRKHL
jgi:two-component system, cell cycle response regulator DivK